MNEQYKARFIKIVKENIKREGVDKLLLSLEKSDFYTAPASTKYHDSEEGGLCKHSVAVFDYLVSEVSHLYSMETIALVSLFHDVCKINYYTIEMRNKKDENGKWISVPFYSVDDTFPYGHGEKSVLMVNDKVKLNVEEMMAIRWHMGAYEGQQAWNTLSTAYTKYPLALYLHIADMKSTYLEVKNG